MGQMWDKSRTELGQKEDSGQKWDKNRDTYIGDQHPSENWVLNIPANVMAY